MNMHARYRQGVLLLTTNSHTLAAHISNCLNNCSVTSNELSGGHGHDDRLEKHLECGRTSGQQKS